LHEGQNMPTPRKRDRKFSIMKEVRETFFPNRLRDRDRSELSRNGSKDLAN
jgi:hypothetical protein